MCTLFTVVVYIIGFFLLYPVLTTFTPTFSVVPVMVVGWGYGLRGGLVAGLLNILLNTLLLNLTGYEPAGWDALVSREGGILGSLFVVLVGMAIGKMSDLTQQLEQRVMDRTAQLQVTNKELKKEITERKEAQEKLEKTQKELSNLSKHLIQSQELERRRIALELHDQFGQDLALVSIEIERLMQEAPQSQAKRLQKLAMRNRALSTYVQTLSHQLHPSSLEHLGLVAASRSLCYEVGRSSDIQIDFGYSDVPRPIPEDVSICLYRVLQESLTNIVKHAEVQAARVELVGSPDKLQLHVCDSGVGFDPESVENEGGLGLC